MSGPDKEAARKLGTMGYEARDVAGGVAVAVRYDEDVVEFIGFWSSRAMAVRRLKELGWPTVGKSARDTAAMRLLDTTDRTPTGQVLMRVKDFRATHKYGS